MDITQGPLGNTYDLSGPIHTPEPSTLAMAGVMGLSALAVLRRRRATV
jgi:hypothetical protein